MKKIIVITLFALFLLSSCSSKPAPTVLPTEAPTFAPTEVSSEVLPAMIKPFSTKLLEVGNIIWVNNSAESLALSYVSLEGEEIEFATLDPNSRNEYGPAYFVGVNVVRDQSGNIVLVYVVNGDAAQKITITADDVTNSKANAVSTFPEMVAITNSRQLPKNLVISNTTNMQVEVFGYDANGTEYLFAKLDPGISTEAGPVFFGDFTVFKDISGKIVLVCVVTEDVQQNCTFSDTLADFWVTP